MSVNTVAKYLYCRVDLRHQQLSQVSGSCEMLDQLKNISEQGQIRADNLSVGQNYQPISAYDRYNVLADVLPS